MLSISSNAFASSTIKSITFPAGLKKIDTYAFMNCKSLTSVVFQGTQINEIPDYCFYKCSALSQIVLPTSITKIGSYAFQETSSIGNIGISSMNDLAYIGSYAFYLSGLTTAEIPSQSHTVGVQAFAGSKIENLTIASNISQQICQRCTSLKNLQMKTGVEFIDMYAFEGCTSLTGFTIPKTLTRILNFAFRSCSSLSNIRLVSDCTLNYVAGGCFYGCFELKTITLNPNDDKYMFENGALTDYNQTILYFFLPYSGVKNFAVPTEMITIGNCAFMGSPSLQRVFFSGNKIREIGYQAFKDCSNLNFIFFSSSSLTKVDNEAFDGCPYLRKCGSFQAPLALQQKLISINIPKSAFSDDCDFVLSCKPVNNFSFSLALVTPFIMM